MLHHFRKYALRRIHDGFKKNKTLSDPFVIEAEYKEALMNLEVIKRQVYFLRYISDFIHKFLTKYLLNDLTQIYVTKQKKMCWNNLS